MIALLALAAAATSVRSDSWSIESLHRLAECVVDREPNDARKVLAMDFRSEAYERRIETLGAESDSCLPPNSTFRSAGVLFAGALAEALLKSEVKRSELPGRLGYDPERETIEARNPAEEMALCTVFKAPVATAAVFGTDPATRREADAENALTSVLPNCLKKDAKIELNRPALRSMLALAPYRIVTTPKGPAQ